MIYKTDWIIFSFLCFFSSLVNSAPDLALSSVSGDSGSTVDVDINFKNTDNGTVDVIVLKLTVLFDTEKFSVTVVNGAALGIAVLTINKITGVGVEIAISPPLDSPLTALRDGTLAQLKLAISANSSFGEHSLRLSEVSMGNALGNEVLATSLQNGTLTVTDPANLAGDSNGDGVINILDVILLINSINGAIVAGNPDCNDNGIVDILDVICAINLIVGR